MIAGGGGGGVLLDYASTYLPAYLQLSSPLFQLLVTLLSLVLVTVKIVTLTQE